MSEPMMLRRPFAGSDLSELVVQDVARQMGEQLAQQIAAPFARCFADVRDHLLLEAANRERASVEALTPASFVEDYCARNASRRPAAAEVGGAA